MKRTHNRSGTRGFALPTVMIASVVMMMVLLSGLVATSAVNSGLREQFNQKQLSSAVDAGMAMAEACMQANNHEVTWSDAQPLKPNTNCYGHETMSCPASSTNDGCYFMNSTQTRMSFQVGAARNNESLITVKATSQSLRATTGTLASQQTSIVSGYQIKRQTTNVSAGGSATCALSSAAKVYCWGANGYGVLGNGSTNSTANTTPALVSQGAIPANATMQSVTTGFTHACALSSLGKAYCWGTGTSGQLGNNSGNTNSYVPVAVAQGEIPPGVRLTSLTNGYYHTCATASDQKVYCWGDNSAGQLGIGGAAGGIYSYPRAVALPVGISATSISAAYQHTCAVGSNTRVYCWGRNAEGQLGNNSATQSTSPVKVVTNTSGAELTATAIGVAYYHSCAVATDGNPYCWGQNSAYQLGNGGTTQSLIATRPSQGGIPTNVKLTHISTYYQHTCAIGSNSLVYCWGMNAYRQIGNASTATATTPTLASTISNAPGDTITGISVGDYHTCINNSAAKMYCWGYNVYGGLGNGTSTSPSDVAQVTGGTSSTNLGSGVYTKLTTKFGSPCAIGPDSRPYCWGDNAYGQLGNGTVTNATLPTGVANGQIPVGATIRDMEQGWTHTCAIASDDKVYCWGNNNNGQLGNGTTSNYVATPVAVSQGEIPTGVKIRSLAVNGLHTCALATNFKAYCWGRNDYGQLGYGITSPQITSPVAVSQGAIPVGVTLSNLATGQSHSCAIGSDDKVYCWGRNDVGSLGNGTLTSSNIPTAVAQGAIPAGVAIRSLTANSLHTCAVGSDGKTYCWGYNSQGQLGNGTVTQASSPVAVSQGAIPAGVTVRSLSAGYIHVCAYASDEKLYCWGDSYANGTTAQSTVPVLALSQNSLPAGVTVRGVVSGSTMNCIFGSDAKYYCWGSNSSGQSGNGTTSMTAFTSVNTVTQTLRWPSSITVDSLIARY